MNVVVGVDNKEVVHQWEGNEGAGSREEREETEVHGQ